MAFQRDPDAGRKAVAWLAVAFTLTVGASVCSFIILAFADDPRQAFAVLGCVMAVIIFFLWSISTPKDKSASRTWLQFWRKVHEPPDPAELYQPRRRRGKKSPLGSNQPPTIESVREIAERHARWVPHGAPPKRNRPNHE
jgi:hypothetical protein